MVGCRRLPLTLTGAPVVLHHDQDRHICTYFMYMALAHANRRQSGERVSQGTQRGEVRGLVSNSHVSLSAVGTADFGRCGLP